MKRSARGRSGSPPPLRVLLLNPPGQRVYLRDYYCSKVSQADYLNHPIDLLFLSGRLAEIGEVSLVDAIVDRLSPEECLLRVQAAQPDVVVGLIGSVSYPEDVSFYQRLRRRMNPFLALSGDILIERRRERLSELPFVDAFVHDFSAPDLADHLRGAPPDSLSNLTLRVDGVPRATPILRRKGELASLPIPLHDLFLGKRYRYPFVRNRRFATVLTEFGCPYPCNFCIMSTLGWKVRPVDSVVRELDLLKSRNVEELFFLDQTFGLGQERAFQLLAEMGRRDYGFGWVCFSRPDVVGDALLERMKGAGCHTVILGVESGNQKILAAAAKGYRPERIRRGFASCHRHGLRTVATIVVGLPEETVETFEETLELLRQLGPNYVSINVAVPRMGTPLRKRAIDLGLADPRQETMDQSGHPVAMPTLTLTREQVAALRARAGREFYFNFQRLRAMGLELARRGRPAEFWAHLRQGASLFRNHWFR